MMRSKPPTFRKRLRQAMLRWHRATRGATSLEWTLLLAVIAIPSYFIIKVMLATLVAHYQLVTTINALPFP